MAENFWTSIDGEPVHVNRRGCKGRWTKKDQKALEALTRAVRRMSKEELDRELGPDDFAERHGEVTASEARDPLQKTVSPLRRQGRSSGGPTK